MQHHQLHYDALRKECPLSALLYLYDMRDDGVLTQREVDYIYDNNEDVKAQKEREKDLSYFGLRTATGLYDDL